MRKKTSLKDIAVIGLALFAMFFGAGNLIFPPYLGTNAGSEWFIGFMCFFIADVGLALVAILSMIKGGDVSIQGDYQKAWCCPLCHYQYISRSVYRALPGNPPYRSNNI